MNAAKKRAGRPTNTANDGRIAQLAEQGMSALAIMTVLRSEGRQVSEATVSRRLRAIRGPMHKVVRAPSSGPAHVVAAPPGSSPTSLPESAEDVPADIEPSVLDEWIRRVDERGKKAHAEGDIETFGKCATALRGLLETKRKITPPARPNPDEAPDMVKLAEDVWARLHKMIDQVVT